MAKGDKKRPKYVEKQLQELNDYFRYMRVQEYHDNPLFYWWCNYLSSNKWYRGFNFHIDREIRLSDGTTKTVRALTGPTRELPMEDQPNWYIQIW